jgi:uncharacterized OB-fold protein
MTDLRKPLPVPDTRSEGFWSATAEHRLAIQRCNHCDRFAHPPVVVCPGCLSPEAEFRFETVSGHGTLRTWTIMRDAFIPGFREDIPWAIGEAELEGTDGIRLLARMADGPDAPYRTGVAIEITFDDVAPGISLPVLRMLDQ